MIAAINGFWKTINFFMSNVFMQGLCFELNNNSYKKIPGYDAMKIEIKIRIAQIDFA